MAFTVSIVVMWREITMKICLIIAIREIWILQMDSIKIGADIIKASKSATNIGVWLDSVLSMDVQINNICKTAFTTFVT